MAKTKRTATRSRKASASKRTSKRTAPIQDRPAHKAFAYSERVAPMVTALKELGGSATKAELFEALYDGDDGQFATERRIPATLRQHPDARALITNAGGVYSLVKRSRRVAKKNGVKRSRKAARSGK